MNKKQSILNHLSSGNTLTKFQAFNEFQVTNLGDVIFQLRNAGYNIITEMQSNKNTKTTFAKYKLKSK